MLYKKWTDYLPELYEKYPTVPKFVIRMILSFGFRWIFRVSSYVKIRTEIRYGDFMFAVGKGKDTSKPIVKKKQDKTIYDIFFIPKWIKIDEFKGYYYIPVTYLNLLKLRHNKLNILKHVFVTTSPEIAKLKGLYILKVYSFKDFGKCAKLKKIAFSDYEVIVRDSNFRLDYYKNKNNEDYV